KRVANIINRNPNVDTFFMRTGGGGGFGSMNTAQFSIQLLPRKQRQETAAQIAQEIRRPLMNFPGFRAFVQLPASLQIGGRGGNQSYNLTVQSADTQQLYLWADRVEAALEAIPEIQDASNDMEMKSPRVDLVIDRDKAAAVGLNATNIEQTLS